MRDSLSDNTFPAAKIQYKSENQMAMQELTDKVNEYPSLEGNEKIIATHHFSLRDNNQRRLELANCKREHQRDDSFL